MQLTFADFKMVPRDLVCIDMKIRKVGPISFTQKYETKKLLKGT